MAGISLSLLVWTQFSFLFFVPIVAIIITGNPSSTPSLTNLFSPSSLAYNHFLTFVLKFTQMIHHKTPHIHNMHNNTGRHSPPGVILTSEKLALRLITSRKTFETAWNWCCCLRWSQARLWRNRIAERWDSIRSQTSTRLWTSLHPKVWNSYLSELRKSLMETQKWLWVSSGPSFCDSPFRTFRSRVCFSSRLCDSFDWHCVYVYCNPSLFEQKWQQKRVCCCGVSERRLPTRM